MKVIISLIFFLFTATTYAQCVDFTGKYQHPDPANPYGNIELVQNGCDTQTNTWYLSDGTTISITVITDGRLRRSCKEGRCSMKAYTLTSDSFKGIEIHQEGDRIKYSNTMMVKLNTGDLEITSESVDWDGQETANKTIWKFVP